MLIMGLQKMTLLDYPNKVACTVFTGGCNLRCPFCHNAYLVTEMDSSTAIPEEKVLSFLKSRVGLLDGVAITGGEPLLQKDIREFIIKVKEIGFSVKLDTNGFFPEILIGLVNDKLVDYVAVDIKNSFEKYPETVGVKNLDLTPLYKTIDFLLTSPVDFEFRTTVAKGLNSEDDIEKIAERIKGADKYFLQNFVDSGNLIEKNSHFFAHDEKTLQNMLLKAKKYVKNAALRGV